MYKQLPNGLLRTSDNAVIPQDPANADYLQFLQWQSQGGIVEPLLTASVSPAWQGLENALRRSTVWQKVAEASKVSVSCQFGFTLLLSALTATHNLDDLQYSVSVIREALSGLPVGDFTPSEIELINTYLVNNNFDIQLA